MIGRLIDLCAKNRWFVIFAFLVAAFGATAALRQIPLDAIPDLSDPQVIVFTEWKGRSPTIIEDQVTYPIASSLLAAPKVTAVRGYSMFGMSFVYVLFEEGTDVYWARSRVLEYMSSLAGRLPEGVTPTLGPDATGIGWVYEYALVDRTGKHDLVELRSIQDYTLRYALASVPGVAEVAPVGGYQRQYQITLDPERLRAYGVTVEDVGRAVKRSNSEVGGRVLELGSREYYVRGRGYLSSLGELGEVAIRAEASGASVRVRDVGSVRFGPEVRRGAADFDGLGESVGAIVVMRYGENARALITRVEAKIDELRHALVAEDIRKVRPTIVVIEPARAGEAFTELVPIEARSRGEIGSGRIDRLLAARALLARGDDAIGAARLRVPEGTVLAQEQEGPGAEVASTLVARLPPAALVGPRAITGEELLLVTTVHEGASVREGLARFCEQTGADLEVARAHLLALVRGAIAAGLLEVA